MKTEYELIVIGASYGGVTALLDLLPRLTAIDTLPIIVVLHTQRSQSSYFVDQLNEACESYCVKQAEEREVIAESTVYIAAGDYHLSIEPNLQFSLSQEDPVQYARPSIDVLFHCAAHEFKSRLIGILLTGSNQDGAYGMAAIHEGGGATIAQSPESCEMPDMPQAAINLQCIDYISTLTQIPDIVRCVLNDQSN
ncbi:MAG: chemotaxis protein CheB [Coxiellaceae bacterium]|nr:chemotaxis protein CheB [Coxiellaceae bacterium]